MTVQQIKNPAKRVQDALAPQPQGRGVASQATHVEQSRAIAEVQAMVVVAQHSPRDETRAMERAIASCRMAKLAERAFFKYARGGSNITGPSIHLAVELARCWGNINYGVSELARSDERGESEMIAFAWDVETNARSATTFIVPHKRDRRGGAEWLTDMRDIYENNANNAARRLREMIFRVLPPWLVEEAKATCAKTLEDGGGEPMPARIAKCAAAFAEFGISRERIEARTGVPMDKLLPVDLAQLQVAFQSIRRGELNADEEFPHVTAQTVEAALRDAPQPEPKASATAATTDPLDDMLTRAADAPPAAEPQPDLLAPTPAGPTKLPAPTADTPTALKAWLKTALAAIAAAPSAEWIDKFHKMHSDEFGRLDAVSEPGYRALWDAMNQRKDELRGGA